MKTAVTAMKSERRLQAVRRARKTPDSPATPAAGAAASGQPVDADQIARLAYALWEARGCQGGCAEEDWLRAEQELCSNRQENR